MSERTKKTLGAVQTLALVAVVVGGLVWAAIVGVPHSASVLKKKKLTDPPAASLYLGVLGLQPDALAAAGVTAVQAGALKTYLQAYLNEHGGELNGLIDTWGYANRAADTATRNVRAGKGDVETLTTRQGELATALANKQAGIDAAFAAATADLADGVKAALLKIKANRPRNVPAQYLVVDRTSSQWRQLRDALSQKKQRDANSVALDADAATIISDADSNGAVITAAGLLESNLAAIKAAME
jgi:hypothetical protein